MLGMNPDLYIYGAGGHAKVVAATARLCGWNIKGFWEDSAKNIGTDFFGSRIVSEHEIPEGSHVFVAFGNNSLRLKRGKELQKKFKLPQIIHPSAQIADGVVLGAGTIVLAQAVIDPDCTIGDFCIVNNSALISHDTHIEAGCHICGNTSLAGNVTVGKCSMLGIGSQVIEDITIGENVVIGAGSTVISNIPDGKTAVGCPAKVIKNFR